MEYQDAHDQDPQSSKPGSERIDQRPAAHDQPLAEDGSGSLFEIYQPRLTSAIIAQRQEIQESHAAEAAAIILEGVEPPEFDFDFESPQGEAHQELLSQANTHAFGSIRIQHISPLGRLVTPGAQFVYALLIITGLSGLIGLAASIDSPVLVLTAGIATPILLPICVWKWIRWLDSTPYYYRLLTSLGEDARNLLQFRLLWKRS